MQIHKVLEIHIEALPFRNKQVAGFGSTSIRIKGLVGIF